jgi:SNF2 family DNA or RNA helicase
MTSLDNIDNGLVYYMERNEIHPANDILVHNMTKQKIISIINDKTIHRTIEYMRENYSFTSITIDNFKHYIKDSFVLKNKDAKEFLAHVDWRSSYDLCVSQPIYPVDAIEYYVINYVNKTNIEMFYNHFIIAICIDTTKEPENFKKIFCVNDEEIFDTFDKPTQSFILGLKAMQLWDWQVSNNISINTDENMEISTRISNCNSNYMHQKMILQPDFLNFNLFYYQRADINFMLQRERDADTKKFILDNKKIVNWGKKVQCEFGERLTKNTKGEKVIANSCIFIPRRTINNYTGELNSFYGGCLCNSPGLGKTLEILTLCALEPSLNLIIVPEHLFDHWIFEFSKHIKEDYMDLYAYRSDSDKSTKYKQHPTKPTIVLTVYKTLETSKQLFKTNFTRLIIDEFHELFDKKDKTFPLIENIKSSYKWAITGTPFVNKDMIYNIMNFVIKNKILDKKVQKYKAYIDTFCEMFRKNTKESVEQELDLPRINERIYILKLSEYERTLYDSLASGVDIETLKTRQMAFCINPNLYFQDANGVSEKFQSVNILEAQVYNMHQADYEKLFRQIITAKKKLLSLETDDLMILSDILNIYDYVIYNISNIEIQTNILKRYVDDIDKSTEKQIKHIWKSFVENKIKLSMKELHDRKKEVVKIDEIKQMETNLQNVRHKMIFFEQQMKFINRKTKKLKYKPEETAEAVEYVKIEDTTEESEEITCSICLSEIEDDFTLVQCGHAYCTLCLRTILMQNPDRCPQCNFSLKNTILYTPRFEVVMNREMADMIKKYGTKIAHLINICKNDLKDEKTIIYCDSPSLIDNLVEFLNENKISTITPTPKKGMLETIEEFKTVKQILVLSSEFNASGLNIQFAKSIILLQPIRGEYAKIRQTEHQIIGRLHRIGQTKEINLIRLIIKDSIETEILRQNKIYDTEFTNSNKKTDYPLTFAETKELTA